VTAKIYYDGNNQPAVMATETSPTAAQQVVYFYSIKIATGKVFATDLIWFSVTTINKVYTHDEPCKSMMYSLSFCY